MMEDIPSAVFLPDELIGEILSYFSVKTLMRLRTVSKAWKTLISNPTFINLHLQKSSRNPHLTLKWANEDDGCFTVLSRVLSVFPVRRLLENLPIGVDDDNFHSNYSYEGEYNNINIIGSYNGLVCFYGGRVISGNSEYWLHFRNLAMGTRSEKLGHFLDFETAYGVSFKFSFGYDSSTETYKVVAFRFLGQDYDSPSRTSEVKVFNLGDNSWRKIQSFPILPLCYVFRFGPSEPSNGVHLIGTVNWLALTNTSRSLYDWKHINNHINANILVILSLSLSTETYTQLLLPNGFDDVLHVLPTLRVLRNCLCFSHDFRGIEFVMWQMCEFGVRESWTQLIKVSYESLRMENLPMCGYMYDIQLLPLHLSENSDMLIFANDEEDNQAFIYKWKHDRLERTRFPKKIYWFSTIDYVESLVPIT